MSYKMVQVNKVTGLLLALCLSACTNCEDMELSRIRPRNGAVKIERIYTDQGIHADVAASGTGQKLIFDPSSFVIKPTIGDSMRKQAGKAEYILIRYDSTFVQRWDCKTNEAIIVARWKNDRI